MTTMKAALVRDFTKALDICEVPVPEVTPGQVLVRGAIEGRVVIRVGADA
ncbi:MAG: hypothetical protein JO369_08815 [Paucibacter sp.]|nr:hypothetical protein [Roseateles sp.]